MTMAGSEPGPSPRYTTLEEVIPILLHQGRFLPSCAVLCDTGVRVVSASRISCVLCRVLTFTAIPCSSKFTRTIAASRPKMIQSTGTSASVLASTIKKYMLDYARDVDFMPFMPLADTLCSLCSQPKRYTFYASKVELCCFLHNR